MCVKVATLCLYLVGEKVTLFCCCCFYLAVNHYVIIWRTGRCVLRGFNIMLLVAGVLAQEGVKAHGRCWNHPSLGTHSGWDSQLPSCSAGPWAPCPSLWFRIAVGLWTQLGSFSTCRDPHLFLESWLVTWRLQPDPVLERLWADSSSNPAWAFLCLFSLKCVVCVCNMK